MNKKTWERFIHLFFIFAVGFTILNLYFRIIWIPYVLMAMFLFLLILQIKDYKKQTPKSKKIARISFIMLCNFLLTNVVMIVAEFVYPY